MLYSSTDPLKEGGPSANANSYPPFRMVDSSVVEHILAELDALGEPEKEG